MQLENFTPEFKQHRATINWIGFGNLYIKEVKRFINVGFQTVASPVVLTLLFLAIFALALGKAVQMVAGFSFIVFLAPGLMVMSMVQNAFANTSSSIMIAKLQGTIVDVLMTPLSVTEILAAYLLAGATRGLLVGLASYIGIIIFVDVPVMHIGWILVFSILSSFMLASLGFIGGIWSEKFDHMAAITHFIITPLSFLSGTFYQIERLPEPFYTIAHFNPFFYMIDGFRGGFLGVFESPPMLSMMILLISNIALLFLAWMMVKSGYKLKG